MLVEVPPNHSNINMSVFTFIFVGTFYFFNLGSEDKLTGPLCFKELFKD